MFKIKNLEENNLINLEGKKEYKEQFEVLSYNEKNMKRTPFTVSTITSPFISARTFGVSLLEIGIDVEGVTKEEHVVLTNINGEEIIITINPNSYFSNEREYKFRISKSEILDDGTLRLRILSKVKGKELGWKCTYDGRPMVYSIMPKEGSKSGYVRIKPMVMEIYSEFISKLEFQQEESGEKAEILIKVTKDGMEILKDKKG